MTVISVTFMAMSIQTIIGDGTGNLLIVTTTQLHQLKISAIIGTFGKMNIGDLMIREVQAVPAHQAVGLEIGAYPHGTVAAPPQEAEAGGTVGPVLLPKIRTMTHGGISTVGSTHQALHHCLCNQFSHLVLSNQFNLTGPQTTPSLQIQPS